MRRGHGVPGEGKARVTGSEKKILLALSPQPHRPLIAVLSAESVSRINRLPVCPRVQITSQPTSVRQNRGEQQRAGGMNESTWRPLSNMSRGGERPGTVCSERASVFMHGPVCLITLVCYQCTIDHPHPPCSRLLRGISRSLSVFLHFTNVGHQLSHQHHLIRAHP